MEVLWVYAHPARRSLNRVVRDAAVDELHAVGHAVVMSDLYPDGWNPVLSDADFGDLADPPPELSRASRRAYDEGTLLADIRREQDRLRAADVVVLQFPLWWYSAPPSSRGGWIDRVFAKGFAYGIADPSNPGRTYRYGDGPLAGRRAQVIVTAGSPEPAMGPRGVNGDLREVLFPLLHGTLWYVGMDVLRPLAVFDADHPADAALEAAVDEVRGRMRALGTTSPIPFRRQNGGDYDEDLVLRPELAVGRTGLAVHVSDDPHPEEAT